MALIKWEAAYSTGLNTIDDQHKKLIELINELHQAMKDRKTKEVMNTILSGLVSYTKTHFKFEEDRFEKFSFPNIAAHKKKHATFVQKISAFQSEFIAGNLLLSMDIMNFLKEWLVEHIQGTDLEYVALFKKNGIK